MEGEPIEYLQGNIWFGKQDAELADAIQELSERLASDFLKEIEAQGNAADQDLIDSTTRVAIFACMVATIQKTLMWAQDNIFLTVAHEHNGKPSVDAAIGELYHSCVPMHELVARDPNFSKIWRGVSLEAGAKLLFPHHLKVVRH